MLFLLEKLKYDKLLESYRAEWYVCEELILQWGKQADKQRHTDVRGSKWCGENKTKGAGGLVRECLCTYWNKALLEGAQEWVGLRDVM